MAFVTWIVAVGCLSIVGTVALVTIPCLPSGFATFVSSTDYVISNCANLGPVTMTGSLNSTTVTITNCDFGSNATVVFTTATLRNVTVVLDGSRFVHAGPSLQTGAVQFTGSTILGLTFTLRNTSIWSYRTNGAYAAIIAASTRFLGSSLTLINSSMDITGSGDAVGLSFGTSSLTATTVDVIRCALRVNSTSASAYNVRHLSGSTLDSGSRVVISASNLTATANASCGTYTLGSSSTIANASQIVLTMTYARSYCVGDAITLKLETNSPLTNNSVIQITNSTLEAVSVTGFAVNVYLLSNSNIDSSSTLSISHAVLTAIALGATATSTCRNFAMSQCELSRWSAVRFFDVKASVNCYRDAVSVQFSTDTRIINYSSLVLQQSDFVASSVVSNAMNVLWRTRSSVLNGSLVQFDTVNFTVASAGTYCRTVAITDGNLVSSTVSMDRVTATATCVSDAVSILFQTGISASSTVDVRRSVFAVVGVAPASVFLVAVNVSGASTWSFTDVTFTTSSLSSCRGLALQSGTLLSDNSSVLMDGVVIAASCTQDVQLILLDTGSQLVYGSTLTIRNGQLSARSTTANVLAVSLSRDSGLYSQSVLQVLNTTIVARAALSSKAFSLYSSTVTGGSRFLLAGVAASIVCDGSSDATGISLSGTSAFQSGAALSVTGSTITVTSSGGYAVGAHFSTLVGTVLMGATVEFINTTIVTNSTPGAWAVAVVSSNVTASRIDLDQRHGGIPWCVRVSRSAATRCCCAWSRTTLVGLSRTA
jgi:hypothetical protein